MGTWAPCRHPALGAVDDTQKAKVGDQYAARHNPFVYFAAITGSAECAQRDVDLSQLPTDLASTSSTPTLSYITPNLCHDGHDTPCVDGQHDLYPRPAFEALWTKIGEMIALGQVRAVDEVKYELKKKSDDVDAWTKQHKELFVRLDHDIQMATREVLAGAPKLLALTGTPRNGADPFVIGLALARDGTVVTQETRSGTLRKPRIPRMLATPSACAV